MQTGTYMTRRQHVISFLLVAAILGLVWLIGCATGRADAAERHHRMTFEFASLVAVDYWQARGVEMPCKPIAHVLSAAEDAQVQAELGADMLADIPACTVDITPAADSYRLETDLTWTYCAEIVHEFGHLAGLEHAYGGVMGAYVDETPFGCGYPRQWTVLKGWRKPPRWVRASPQRVYRLWIHGHELHAATIAWRHHKLSERALTAFERAA